MKRYLLCLFCMMTFCFVLTDCNSEEEDVGKVIVGEFLTLYQSTDSSAGTYLVGRDNNIELQFVGIQALLAKKMTFLIDESKKTDDGYLVKVRINSVDFKAVFESIVKKLSENTPEDVILEELYNALEDNSAEIREFIINIPVQKIGEEYRILLTSELSNALFGGYNEYLTELIGEMNNE